MESFDKDTKLQYIIHSFEQEENLIENPIIKSPVNFNNKRKRSFRKSKLRWLGLFFQCFLLSGQKFCFDNPQALQSSLTSPLFLNLNSAQYNLFYSFYSSSNMILPLFGGLLIDKLSIRIAMFVFSSIVIIGQGIFLLGGGLKDYTYMIIGRLIFGLGGECLAVTQTSSIARWFKNKELALALSLALGCNRMGSLLNSSLTPYLFNKTQDYILPMSIGLLICVFSWFCGIALNYMDKISDMREGKIVEVDEDEDQEVEGQKKGICINFKDFCEFKSIYWLIIIVLALSYGSLFTFTGNANDLYSKLFVISNQTAGYYITLIYLTSGIMLPFIGFFIDAFGKRTLILCFSLICFFFVHVTLVSFDEDINSVYLIIPVILCGVFYACFGGFIWNSIALVVREEQLGIAYGGGYALMNINLVFSPLIYGVIHDHSNEIKFGYFWAEIFLIGQIILCFGIATCILILDWKGDKKLMKKIERRDIYKSLQKSGSRSFMSFG